MLTSTVHQIGARPPRETIKVWFNHYFQEVAKNTNYDFAHKRIVASLSKYSELEAAIAEAGVKQLQDKFFGRQTEKVKNYLGMLFKRTREGEASGIVWDMLQYNARMSADYYQQRENFLNQLWLKIFVLR